MARIALPARGLAAGSSYQAAGSRQRTDAASPSAVALSWVAMAVFFAVAILSLYLLQVSAIATAGYELQRVEMERKGWLARNEQLELEIAKRRSLVWVEAQAAHRLGMVRAEKPVYVRVDGPAEALGARDARPGAESRTSDPHPLTAEHR